MTAKTFSQARPVAENVEWLAVRVGVEISYDPGEQWFIVKTGDGVTTKNIDLREALDVARDFVEEQ